MTAADRPSVTPRVGDTITTAEQLEALPEDSIVMDRDRDPWQRGEDGWPWPHLAEPVRALAPFTVLYVPGEQPRPSVTDDARADSHTEGVVAEADRWLNTHRITDTWRTMNRVRDALVRLAAGRAEMTTAPDEVVIKRPEHPSPGVLRLAAADIERQGTGWGRLPRSLPSFLRHVADALDAPRAETTTTTTEDYRSVYAETARIIHERRQGYSAGEIAQALADAGLLATARTEKERQPRGLCEHSPTGTWNDPPCTCYIYPDLAVSATARTRPTEGSPLALHVPGDGCQCGSYSEDRGGGHFEVIPEYNPACPEHSEHLWNPRIGRWELPGGDDGE